MFIVAVEQRLLPHERSTETEEQLEEERRLLFVGITRAQQQLQMSLVKYRSYRGGISRAVPSMFLMELPRQEMEVVTSDGLGVLSGPTCSPTWSRTRCQRTCPLDPGRPRLPIPCSARPSSCSAAMTRPTTRCSPGAGRPERLSRRHGRDPSPIRSWQSGGLERPGSTAHRHDQLRHGRSEAIRVEQEPVAAL